MSDLTKFLLKAFARKGLSILGAALFTYGILTQEESDSFVSAYLEEIVGSILVGASALWTWAYQFYVKRKVVTALKLPSGASSETLEATMEK